MLDSSRTLGVSNVQAPRLGKQLNASRVGAGAERLGCRTRRPRVLGSATLGVTPAPSPGAWSSGGVADRSLVSLYEPMPRHDAVMIE